MQSTEGSKYALSRAGTKDLTAITALWYRSFDATIIRELFMGCQSEADLVKLAAKYERETLEDPKDIWIKVSDRNSGELVGAAQWKLHSLHAAAQPRYRSVAAEWLPENLKKQSTHLLDGINAVRVESNPDPFILLHAFFTSPEHRRRGVGTMMMEWGRQLADLLALPVWIDASPEGALLYSALGYREVGPLMYEGHEVGKYLRRDAVFNNS